MSLRYTVSVAQVAQYLHVSRQTVNKHRNRLKLPSQMEREQVELVIDSIRKARKRYGQLCRVT